jgi:hypothetical protein
LFLQIAQVQFSLSCTLLVKLPTENGNRTVVNFDPDIATVIREAECLKKLGLVVPPVTEALIACKEKLFSKRAMMEVVP